MNVRDSQSPQAALKVLFPAAKIQTFYKLTKKNYITMAKLTKQQLHAIQDIAKIIHKQNPNQKYSTCVRQAYADWRDNKQKYSKK